MSIVATWHIELNVECPSCKEDVDLLAVSNFWEGKHDIEPGQSVTDLEVCCPECQAEFSVDTTY